MQNVSKMHRDHFPGNPEHLADDQVALVAIRVVKNKNEAPPPGIEPGARR